MTNNATGRLKRSLLAFVLSIAMVVTLIPTTGLTAYAEATTFQNVEVNATATGEVNGPWTLTFTAEQTRAPSGSEVNWGADSEIKISLAGVLDSANATISCSDATANATLENDQITVTGYDFSANTGTPLTITVTDVAVDDWSLDQNNNIAAGVETSLDAISGIKWFKNGDNMHSVEFPAPTVKVVKLARPQVTWSGKTVSWDAVTGADGYNVTYMGGTTGTKNISTTNTSIDLTDYIDTEGNYTVRVEAKRGAHVSALPGSAGKRFYRITATPSYRDNPTDDSYQAGTDGGTVSGSSTAAGTTFVNMTEEDWDYMPGAIKAFVGEDDEVTITATPATGYTGKLYQGNTEVTSPYTVTVESAQYHSFAARFDKIPPDPVTVILEVGEGHESFAQQLSDVADEAGYEPTLEGTTLTLTKVPVLDKHGETRTVRGGANDVVYELVRTAFGPGFGYWRDNGEEYINTALNTIDNYTSEADIYDELGEATDPIADGQKYYLLWAKPATKATLTIEKPICGTHAHFDQDTHDYVNGPTASAGEDSMITSFGSSFSYWIDDQKRPIEDLVIKGGETYKGAISFVPKFGYYFDEGNPPTINAENAESAEYDYGAIVFTVTADHDWDTENGEVTKRPSSTEEGVMTYKCKHYDTCGGTKTEPIPKLVDPVAKNVQTGYEYMTLADAHAEVAEGQTIQLLKDIDLGDGSFPSTKTYTLDLDGHELKSTANVVVANGGTLTITGNGTIHNTKPRGWDSALYVGHDYSAAAVVVKSGTIKSDNGYGIANFRYGNVTVEGGHVISGSYHAIDNYGTLTVKGEDTLIEAGVYGIQNAGGFSGKIFIEGGTVRGNLAVRAMGHGTIDISGGTLEGRTAGIGLGNPSSGNYDDVVTFKEGSTSIVKAPADKTFRIDKEGPVVNIYGGKFSDQVGNGDYYNRTTNQYLAKEEGGDLYVLTPPAFKEIVWSGKDTDSPTAKAVFTYGDDDSLSKEVDCTVSSKTHARGTTYTATVSVENSLDGKEHSDSTTLYKVFNLYVQGKHVTGEICDDILGDGTVSFDPETNTLTLNNATIEMSRREYGFSGDKQEYGIRANLGSADGMQGGTAVTDPLTINLIGTNNIVNEKKDEQTTNKFGITVTNTPSVTYTGGGSLNISMSADEADTSYFGIDPHQSTTFDGTTVNVDITGSTGTINGVRLVSNNTINLTNGAKMRINVGNGYAVDNNSQTNEDLNVAEGCVFEAISGGANGALHGNNWIKLSDATKELGVLVNADPTKDGSKKWDGEASFATFKYVRIPYEHQWGEWEVTTEPTCTEPGEETRTCTSCDEGVSETREVAVLGHDWGEWEVVKDPSATEVGQEERTCSRCGEKETREIPRVTYDCTEGDGNVWTLGDSGTSDFTFERSFKDEDTFEDWFTGEVQVDGIALSEEDFTATAGSVNVSIKDSYLNTLAVGEHTVTCVFADGEATAKLTVKESEEPAPNPDDIAPTPNPDNPADADNGTDNGGDKKMAPGKVTPKDGGTKTGDMAETTSAAVMLLVSAMLLAGALYRRREN